MVTLRRACLLACVLSLSGALLSTAAANGGARPLRTLLVTGDSMSEPLGEILAQELHPRRIDVVQSTHAGAGISTSFVVDWVRLAARQVARLHPDGVVVFIGANDGFPLGGTPCCDALWRARYAARVRTIAELYRQHGAARVYWITVPAPREPARQPIVAAVDAAIAAALEPSPASGIETIDAEAAFTPGGVYRPTIEIAGHPVVVRRPDGIHLNLAGSRLLAGIVIGTLRRDGALRPARAPAG